VHAYTEKRRKVHMHFSLLYFCVRIHFSVCACTLLFSVCSCTFLCALLFAVLMCAMCAHALVFVRMHFFLCCFSVCASTLLSVFYYVRVHFTVCACTFLTCVRLNLNALFLCACEHSWAVSCARVKYSLLVPVGKWTFLCRCALTCADTQDTAQRKFTRTQKTAQNSSRAHRKQS